MSQPDWNFIERELLRPLRSDAQAIERVLDRTVRARPSFLQRLQSILDTSGAAPRFAVGLAAAGALVLVSWPLLQQCTAQGVSFILPATEAHAVSLVGDFNDWNEQATPMERRADGRWIVKVGLKPGRHEYAFIVNGTEWRTDPAAALAPGGELGGANSVLLVEPQ